MKVLRYMLKIIWIYSFNEIYLHLRNKGQSYSEIKHENYRDEVMAKKDQNNYKMMAK